MIRIFCVIWNFFIIWFSHAIRLVKSGRQFVHKIFRFLYQNFLTDKSDGDNSLEHRGVLRKMELFVNIVTDKKLLTIFTKSSTLDLWLGFLMHLGNI